jgi:hypothetical protein
MLRPSTGQVVLTDPIPESDRMPGTVATDVGKVLTSLYGFEEIKYGTPLQNGRKATLLLLSQYSRGELLAIYYMCAVHFLRLIPYHEHLRESYLEVLKRVIGDGLRL